MSAIFPNYYVVEFGLDCTESFIIVYDKYYWLNLVLKYFQRKYLIIFSLMLEALQSQLQKHTSSLPNINHWGCFQIWG